LLLPINFKYKRNHDGDIRNP